MPPLGKALVVERLIGRQDAGARGGGGSVADPGEMVGHGHLRGVGPVLKYQTLRRDEKSTARIGGRAKDPTMATIALGARVTPTAIPVGDVLPWAIFGGLLMFIMLYFVGAEQGVTSIFSGSYVHEFVHDGRHLLGFPCH